MPAPASHRDGSSRFAARSRRAQPETNPDQGDPKRLVTRLPRPECAFLQVKRHFRVLGDPLSAEPRASDKHKSDYSLGAHAAGVRDLLSACGFDRVTMIGHSLGGGIALQFSYLFPERVNALVLVASGGLGREVNLLWRAPTFPESEWVLPVIASRMGDRTGKCPQPGPADGGGQGRP